MGRHRADDEETPHSARPFLTGALIVGCVLVLGFAFGPPIIGQANPTPALPAYVIKTTAAANPMFISGLIAAGVDINGEEELALSTAHHTCESSMAAATSPEAIVTVGAILGLSATESDTFVRYARQHCNDLT